MKNLCIIFLIIFFQTLKPAELDLNKFIDCDLQQWVEEIFYVHSAELKNTKINEEIFIKILIGQGVRKLSDIVDVKYAEYPRNCGNNIMAISITKKMVLRFIYHAMYFLIKLK